MTDGVTPSAERQMQPGARVGIPWIVFVVVVLCLSWARFLPLTVEPPAWLSSMIAALGLLSPLLAALVVCAWSSGKKGVRELLVRAVRWRVHPGWYATCLVAPVMLYGAVLTGYVLADGPRLEFDGEVLGTLPTIVIAGLVVFTIEELGWRGWFQWSLQARLRWWVAALPVGAVWGLWHAPLHFNPATPQSDIPIVTFVVLTTAVSVVFAWIFNATGHSVLLVTVAHVGFNLAVGVAVLALPEGAGTYVALCAGVTVVLAAVLAVRSNGSGTGDGAAEVEGTQGRSGTTTMPEGRAGGEQR